MKEDIWEKLILQIKEDLDIDGQRRFGNLLAVYEMLDVLPDQVVQKYLQNEDDENRELL